MGIESPAEGKGPLGQLRPFPLPAGLTVHDVDIFEINEAFASQVSLCFSTLSQGCRGREGARAEALPPLRLSTVWRS